MMINTELLSDVEAGTPSRATNLYALVRQRADMWNRLRDACRRLRRTGEGVSAHRIEARAEEQRSLHLAIRGLLATLGPLEGYHVFPGSGAVAQLEALLDRGALPELAEAATRFSRARSTGSYRREDPRAYFEVLLVDEGHAADDDLRQKLRALRTPEDRFRYEVVVVRTLEDALLAVMANPSIAACVLRFSFPFTRDVVPTELTARLFALLREDHEALAAMKPGQRTARLGALLARLRPDLDLYRVTDAPVENVVGGARAVFRRVFYQVEDHQDLHVSLLRGVAERFETPFFDALRHYAERPTAMFHALPVSRGRTIAKSNWIGDFGTFYGSQLFMAETSATTGGLDSLLQPVGSLKEAQRLAARAFGSDRSFFVTNGTSTANKIVLQALCSPGDLVMLSHDCHKSHPYACILSGAHPVYLDGYALSELSMYGGIPLATIKHKLLQLKACGQLHRLRLLLLTNITFDGVTYDPYRVMKEVLAIHPDIVFVWDEAWFAYGRFSPLTRSRTAMDAARRLEAEFRGTGPKVRVYATHSTHKTLTALRQGSMIHVFDTDYERAVEESFHEAYMMHTSTSPNYQILASLDVGRRQAELEGHTLVNESIDLALLLRERIRNDDTLRRYFRVLGPAEMVPEGLRPSAVERYIDADGALAPVERAWATDEFVLDPTRVTIHVGRTGMDGDTFKRHLMDRHAVHINKTSRNSVLFLVHVGSSRGTIAHLVGVLSRIAEELDRWHEHATAEELGAHAARVRALTDELPPLPDFSAFHPSFVPEKDEGTGAGDMRRAYYLAHRPEATRFVTLDAGLAARVKRGQTLVAACFVTPYPPGFPVLMPGQVITHGILAYLLALDTKEIHGLHPELGLRVFRSEALTPPTKE